jgi:hypothetical protein
MVLLVKFMPIKYLELMLYLISKKSNGFFYCRNLDSFIGRTGHIKFLSDI